MKRSQRIVASLLLAVLLSGVWVFPAAAEQITLTFAIIALEEEMGAWQGIVDAWNAEHDDVKVELERLAGGWGDYRDQMLVRVAAGTPPDIGRMGAALMPSMIESGAILDLMPYAANDPKFEKDMYFPPAIDYYVEDGKMWGMPISILPMAFYANKTLFDERGVPLPAQSWAEAWTWDEWRETLRKLTFGEEPDRTYGVHIDPWIERNVQYFWQNGIDILNEDRTQSNMADPRAIEVLEMFNELWNEERVAWTHRAGFGWGELFHMGRLGMFADGPWMIPGTMVAPFEITMLPFPAGPAGPVTVNFIDAYVVFNGSKYPEEAWEVVRFFTEESAVIAQVAHGSTGIPVRRDLALEFLSDGILFHRQSLVDQHVWLEAVDYGRGMPFTANWSDLVDQAFGPYIGGVFDGNISPTEAALTMDSLINGLLKR